MKVERLTNTSRFCNITARVWASSCIDLALQHGFHFLESGIISNYYDISDLNEHGVLFEKDGILWSFVEWVGSTTVTLRAIARVIQPYDLYDEYRTEYFADVSAWDAVNGIDEKEFIKNTIIKT